MDISEKNALSKHENKVKSKGNRNTRPKDVRHKSTNYDFNILCDSFTYLCTTAHLEPLLQSAWWLNANWQNQETTSGRVIHVPSDNSPSTSTAVRTEGHGVADSRNSKPEGVVAPTPKRPLSALNPTAIPAKKRRIVIEK